MRSRNRKFQNVDTGVMGFPNSTNVIFAWQTALLKAGEDLGRAGIACARLEESLWSSFVTGVAAAQSVQGAFESYTKIASLQAQAAAKALSRFAPPAVRQ